MPSVEAIRSSQRAVPRDETARPAVNVGHVERMASAVGGGLLLALGLARRGPKGLMAAGLGAGLLYRAATGHCYVYEALGANTADRDRDHGLLDSVPARAGVRVEESILIQRSPEELYRFWSDYANLPRFMPHIEKVTDLGGGRSHWVARGPLGVEVAWDAEIHNEVPNALIAWRSLDDSEIGTAGSVHFVPAPGDRGTIVRINQKINPPAGKLGTALARVFGNDPARLTRETLRHLKQLMESGEIPTVAGQPSGRE